MEQGLSIAFGSASDRGLRREENQDSFGKFPRDDASLQTPAGQLFVVADGMGGHAGGREASHMAVRIIAETYFTDQDNDLAHRLQHALTVANQRIYQASNTRFEFFGMGTTCTALALQGNTGCIAHVGDSRAYRINPHNIEQLTRDHSKVAEMQRLGMLTAEEARHHPEKSHLYRALGIYTELEVDMIPDLQLVPGDHFLLCTDGLAKVAPGELQKIVLSHTPQRACEKLVALANARGGEDNTTVQVIRVLSANAARTGFFSRVLRKWRF
ncbi:MAG: protein phosphatase 2C domain-containing protein [candidate division KSB1 bacterium]|nr:protein phosphatase 2C domain-containing protein [candidate division KSB1 bacterium]MDZ7275517.1 protein phosphatase 2C domain-containing protein [candidate division KSB1 bacterium]MDZ7286171.1 protein phosphatase 2C domain-containing protein [candidate division KSB1 bacterium]MDZ7296397.1 protein phosphatase 2C domain-containing protein [candidate division KSB1 bacterium]MDZ7306232.1 protein phosphatase 2C domain-containing protein [candidate division KSB1 bacterium]